MKSVAKPLVSRRVERILSSTLLYAGLILAVSVLAFPLYWMVATAVLPSDQVFLYPPKLFPFFGEASITPFINVFEQHPLLRWLATTTSVAAASSAGSIFLGILGGYSLSRFRFRGASLSAFSILLTQMLPGSLMIIPIYMIFRDLSMLDTLWGLAIAYMTFNLPFCIWLLKGFFDGVPVDLEEAGLVDGCTRLGSLFRITVPLVLPGVVATFFFAFIGAWSDYVFALTMLSSTDKFTYAVGIAAFKGQYVTPWNEIMAASFLSTIPIFFLFLFMQRYLLAGLTAGGVKG